MNHIVYMRYLTSFRAKHDPHFDLAYYRGVEISSLDYQLAVLSVKVRNFLKELISALKRS